MSSKPIDVFFCTATPEREEMARQTLAWWREQKGIRLCIVTPKVVGCTPWEFQCLRRRVAEFSSKSEIYILTDDDMQPTGDLQVGLKAMETHPQFGIISAWPANCQIARWTPENYLPFEDLDVMEVHDVGGLRFIRQGAMDKGWPQQTRAGYDAEHCEAMRMAGYRVGYAQHFRAEHLGEGKSTVWSYA